MDIKNSRIGFMQGRLSNMVENRIQCFPWEDWENEFFLANLNRLSLMEWTLDSQDLYKNPLMSDLGRKKIKFLSKKYQIDIPSLTGDCFMQKPFWKFQNSKSLQKEFIDICIAASKLGIKYIVVPLVDNGKFDNNAQKEFIINFLNNLKDFFLGNKLSILFESELEPMELKKFIERFPENIFGINYDIGNSASLNFDTNEEFILYGKRILNIHIKDRLIGGNTVPLGEGNADFNKVSNNIRDIKYNGNFVLQTARSKDNNHVDAILKYKKFFEDLF